MNLELEEKFKLIWQKILSSERILLVSHLNPDIDAISSLGAMIEIVKREGKQYLAFAKDKRQDNYFLPNEGNNC